MKAASRAAAAGLLLLAGCALRSGADCADAADLRRFSFTDAAAWRHCEEDGGCLELYRQSDYRPPHRSPLNLALLQGHEFGDFDLSVQARQTGREYPHRDLVVVFAHRDAAHFCYAHLASAADESAHHVQLVDGADRRPVTTARSAGVAWGDGWHELRIRRRGEHVTVWFDGGEPVLQARAPEWRGEVGLGSFDDTGRFRSLRIERR